MDCGEVVLLEEVRRARNIRPRCIQGERLDGQAVRVSVGVAIETRIGVDTMAESASRCTAVNRM